MVIGCFLRDNISPLKYCSSTVIDCVIETYPADAIKTRQLSRKEGPTEVLQQTIYKSSKRKPLDIFSKKIYKTS